MKVPKRFAYRCKFYEPENNCSYFAARCSSPETCSHYLLDVERYKVEQKYPRRTLKEKFPARVESNRTRTLREGCRFYNSYKHACKITGKPCSEPVFCQERKEPEDSK